MIKALKNRIIVLTQLTFFFIAYFSEASFTQSLCTGTLGHNIFTSGDFGSGNKVIYPFNPGLAPGFIYTTQVPPSNGQYILTNDMSQWPASFPAWIAIGDNSSDPEGYMMVVNANVSAGIFYEQMIDDVCENTLYEFSADVINLIMNGIAGHSLPDVSFLIDDVEVYTTGPIEQDEQWHTYGFTFYSGPGQSSLKLSLRNNSPGGAGNDLAIDNISFRVCGPELSASVTSTGKVCEDIMFPELTAQIAADTGVIQWQLSTDNGTNWVDISGANERTYRVDEQSTGIYYFRFLYSNTELNLTNSKCRNISDSIRVEIVPIIEVITDTLCKGLTRNLNGIDYDETGVYLQELTAVNGCDSIIELHLVIVDDPPMIPDFEVTRPSCIGADDGTLMLVSAYGAHAPFDFHINDSINAFQGIPVMLTAGKYTTTIVDRFGCFNKDELIIPEGPVLDIQTIDDLTIVLGHSIELETSTNIPLSLITWTSSEYIPCADCLSPLVTPAEDATYIIVAETFKGCIDIDSVTVRVDKDPVIYIPNVFSPNGDQINDYFQVSTDPLNIISVDLAVVYDRWGTIVSEKTNIYNEGQVILWDGTSHDQPVSPGVYLFIMKYSTVDRIQRTVRGDITVIK